ncbi:YSIRK-targeted surface antigen transcriptional regulator [Atopobacter sp. AH10]|uniref:YSIRK-targeted surface antigen transcriptional regulator n=1 Tax=Atopobacter sp. AH10 TaxID=2315861 RepID=UPI000EF1A50A|nr:YSIRK-targeted surface antigen transcriptional regulator [Atopobacter sp. AH10]RLK63333.1 YSIRK-targeted surface antigen transcriptional regulator [Atopobacter sp. AH10]
MNFIFFNALQAILPVALTLHPDPNNESAPSKNTFPAADLYNFDLLADYGRENQNTLQFVPGFYNEWFAIAHYNMDTVIVGPFLLSPLEGRPITKSFNHLLSKEDAKRLKHELLALPLLSLEGLSEMLILINFCMTEKLSNLLPSQIKKYSDLIQWEHIQQTLDSFDHPRCNQTQQFYQFEINLVRYLQGKTDVLTEGTPCPNKRPVKSLKRHQNYTTFLLELMNRVALAEGVSAKKSYALRTNTLKANAASKSPEESVKIRFQAAKDYRDLIEELAPDHSDCLVDHITNYIHSHLTDSLKVSEIARHFYISESQLRKRFRDEMGLSVSEYIGQEKIKCAKKLLTQATSLSLKDIAKQLGYFDQSHFSRSFRSATGLSPSEYKRSKVTF